MGVPVNVNVAAVFFFTLNMESVVTVAKVPYLA